jgi:uncharacterized protein YjlB
MSLTPVSSLRVSKHIIPAHNLIPNYSIQQKPLLHYHGAFQRPISASKIEAHLTSIGAVKPQWRYTMYKQTHFHSTSHEVLCISHGRARLCFGGEENNGRVEPVVEQGDVVIVPAGVGHRLLEDLDGGWDMCYGKNGEEKKVNAIKNSEWFRKDPIYGDEGPTMDV